MNKVYCKNCKYKKRRGGGYGTAQDFCLKTAKLDHNGRIDITTARACASENLDHDCPNKVERNLPAKIGKWFFGTVLVGYGIAVVVGSIMTDPRGLIMGVALGLPILSLVLFVGCLIEDN